MTCELVQTRILQLADPARVPAELRQHAAGCPGCAAVLAGLVALEDAIPRIPVPPADPAVKTAFLERVTAPEPIIVPSVPRPMERPWRVQPKHLAGLAAGFLVAVGVWSLSGRSNRPEVVAEGPRHDLLGAEVRHLVRLAKAAGPADRVAVWSDVTGDIRAEVGQVYLYAPDKDIQALGTMFDAAVTKGLVAQAAQLQQRADVPAAERNRLLTAATEKLTAAADDAAKLAEQAPPQAKPVLLRMSKTAQDGRAKLEQLRGGV